MPYKINDQHPHGQAVPPHQTNWIDYPKAEAALFSAVRSELRLIAIDHQHHFGAEAVRMVNQIAEAIYPKALAILQQHGTRRAFSDRHLWEKCQNWAEWWCARIAGHRRRKRPHTKYSPESASPGPRRTRKAKRSNKARYPRPARSAPPPRRPYAAPDRRPARHWQKHCWRGAAALCWAALCRHVSALVRFGKEAVRTKFSFPTWDLGKESTTKPDSPAAQPQTPEPEKRRPIRRSTPEFPYSRPNFAPSCDST